MNLFLMISILFGLTALFSVINERFLRLESAIGLMLLALITTLALAAVSWMAPVDSISWLRKLVETLDLSSVLLNGVLCFMLFAGSAGVRIKSLEDNQWVVLSLAVGSTILACGIIGFLLHAVLGWFGVPLALTYAFVFGALISPTDPIAALAILKAAGLPKPLEAVITGESLFNDGVGVVLFTMALAFIGSSTQPGLTDAVTLFIREVLGGAVLGAVVGIVMHHLLIRTSEFGTQLLITLAMVSLGYSVALRIDVSGPIGMVIAGLIAGNLTIHRLTEVQRAPLSSFWKGIDEILNSLLFVMMGLVVVMVHGFSLAPLGISIAAAIAVCLVARAVSVYLPLAALSAGGILKADSKAMTKLLTWAGLRGGLALALVLSLPDSAEKPLMINMTFGVVAFSILVQGSTIRKFFSPAFLRGILNGKR